MFGGNDRRRARRAKAAPQPLFADSAPAEGRSNYLRFRLSPNPVIALAARVKIAGEEFVGEQRELLLLNDQPNQEQPNERLIGDAIAGYGSLFSRQDTIEAAWAVVDPVLAPHDQAHPYLPGSWGPKQADALIAPTRAGTTPCPTRNHRTDSNRREEQDECPGPAGARARRGGVGPDEFADRPRRAHNRSGYRGDYELPPM